MEKWQADYFDKKARDIFTGLCIQAENDYPVSGAWVDLLDEFDTEGIKEARRINLRTFSEWRYNLKREVERITDKAYLGENTDGNEFIKFLGYLRERNFVGVLPEKIKKNT